MADIDKMVQQALDEAAGRSGITSDNFNDVVFRALNNVNAQSDQTNYLVKDTQDRLTQARPDIRPKERINLATARNDAERELMLDVIAWRTYASNLNRMLGRLRTMWRDTEA